MTILHPIISTLFLKVACYYAWVQFAVLLHELAHAIVGKLVGFRPTKIQVGTGKLAFRFSFLGLQWVFCFLPWGGLTYHKTCHLPGLRWRGALMVLAGPASDFLLLLLLINYQPHLAALDSFGVPISMSGMVRFLIIFQVVSLLYSLVPHDAVVGGVALPNDGKQLVRYISGKCGRDLREALAATEPYREMVARYAPDFQIQPSSWVAQLTPEEAAQWQESEKDSQNGNFSAAIEKLEALLQSPKLVGPERAMILDGVASIAVMRGYEAPPEKVLGWAREAHHLVPKARTVLGTLGGALVQNGNYTGAIEMLTPLTTPENEEVDRVISSIYLAKAWDRKGDALQAAQWFSKACELGGHEEIRDRIAAELSPEALSFRA